MGTVFRKTYTIALPTGADGSPRLLVESGAFVAKYRDVEGLAASR
ncbi:MAG: hypothetical protein U0939_13870 [Pirellulales bacterium]